MKLKVTFPIVLLAMAFCQAPAFSQSEKKSAPKKISLRELLKQVKNGGRLQSAEDKQREAEFAAQKNKQAALLKEAQNQLTKLQKQSDNLENSFDRNEAEIARMEETLRIRLGTMGELFGVIRQVAGDTRSKLELSLTSSQYPGRGDKLEPLATSKKLPQIDQLEELWYLLQQEMHASGKIVRFKAPVMVGGKTIDKEVVRVGVFNAFADGKFLNWNTKSLTPSLKELPRQPAGRYMAGVSDLMEAKDGYARVAIDPSRGSLLALLLQTPTLRERVDQGGYIGYIIIALGTITLLVGLLRLLVLLFVSIKIRSQRSNTKLISDNPLGRILNVHKKNPDLSTEGLEHKLDEAIMQESTKLERFLWAIKIVSVVAPLMGLLGTVTGMINTFQAITLHGTGDPRTMAGGISEALVTTTLGLIVAIPLVLLHAWLKNMSKGMIEILEEQSIGIVASHAEQEQNSASETV